MDWSPFHQVAHRKAEKKGPLAREATGKWPHPIVDGSSWCDVVQVQSRALEMLHFSGYYGIPATSNTSRHTAVIPEPTCGCTGRTSGQIATSKHVYVPTASKHDCADHTLDWTGRNKVLPTQTRSHRRTQANKWHEEYLHFYQVIRFYQVERTCSITNDHFITIKFGWLNLQHHKVSVMAHNLEVDNIGQVGKLLLICKVQNKSNPTCIEFHFRL